MATKKAGSKSPVKNRSAKAARAATKPLKKTPPRVRKQAPVQPREIAPVAPTPPRLSRSQFVHLMTGAYNLGRNFGHQRSGNDFARYMGMVLDGNASGLPHEVTSRAPEYIRDLQAVRAELSDAPVSSGVSDDAGSGSGSGSAIPSTGHDAPSSEHHGDDAEHDG